MIIIGIIAALILFSVIVLIHEYGHFKAAKTFGVKVEEFGLGIPPRAKKLFTDKSGTLFSLNWLPIGGFVRLKGEMPNSFLLFDKSGKKLSNDEIKKFLNEKLDLYNKSGDKIPKSDIEIITKKIKENYSKDSLMTKPYWQQAIIILAGVFMNFVLAFLLFSFAFFIGIKPIGINDKIETNLNIKLIPNVQQGLEIGLLEKKSGVLLYPIKGSPAERTGIKNGDVLLEIKSNSFDFIETNSPKKVIEIINNNKGKEISLNIIPKGEKEKKIINIKVGENGKIGSYLGENIIHNKDFKYKYGFFDSIKYGALETYNQALLTFKAIGMLGKKLIYPKDEKEREEALEQVSGPIGLVSFISNYISAGFMFLVIIGAIISINLGVFNLLPIPALDGGRFIFIMINGSLKVLFGKKAINDKVETLTHLLFFAILIFLSIIISYNDILKIIEK
ncbi:hypothetical protein CSB07_00170 [Candidatus Gracilibacteria bacterium]|nr:MAG: hypothetical protein CSB07_00170 [Candidatus Gracilibacteria bacterium]PIE85640.1 MAG: hypothetical protein CSA08_00880 [Candidatus Gracilibacteria bacterium]